MRLLPIIFLLLTNALLAQGKKPEQSYPDVQPVIFALSTVMMHDVVNPPAASRFYSYAMLGAYEIVAQNENSFPPLSKLIKNYKDTKISLPSSKYNYQVAALYCILETGKRMLPSGYMLQGQEDKYIANLRRNKLSTATIKASVEVATKMAEAIVNFAKTDGYSKLSTKLRYTPVKGDRYWYPTPPAYIEAVEPNWRIIRPMLIDSFNQFAPMPPVEFSTDSSSQFHKMALEVYNTTRKLTPQQLHQASFWDCNPFAVNTSGHMSIGYKKISPGGHWMNITGIASNKAKLSFAKAVLLHTVVSITLVDAFISCWDEKYRSNRIRPETYINKYIDLHWQPLLQTPPFPEYTSGHSVISAAAAEVLTYFLGDDFAYSDDSEEFFEIKPRSFTSFRHAASEAAISRLYGGIHFMDAITNGQVQGKAIGEKAIETIKKAGLRQF